LGHISVALYIRKVTGGLSDGVDDYIMHVVTALCCIAHVEFDKQGLSLLVFALAFVVNRRGAVSA
jgi:hypothetical protein